MPTPDEIAAFLASLPRPKEKDASAAKAAEMLAQNKARGGGPSLPQGYIGESLESLRKGAGDVYQGTVETFGPQGFGERYREAPIPQAAEAGPMGRSITGPALRAGYSALTSPAATMLGEIGAATGFAPLTPAPPRPGNLAGMGRSIPEHIREVGRVQEGETRGAGSSRQSFGEMSPGTRAAIQEEAGIEGERAVRRGLEHLPRPAGHEAKPIVVYHGTPKAFDRINPEMSHATERGATFFTQSPYTAEIYTKLYSGKEKNPNIHKVILDRRNHKTYDVVNLLTDPKTRDNFFDYIAAAASLRNEKFTKDEWKRYKSNLINDAKEREVYYDGKITSAIINMAKDEGVDTATIRNHIDLTRHGEGPQDQLIVMNPKRILPYYPATSEIGRKGRSAVEQELSQVGAAASPYRPPALAATEDLGARGLIQQQYGLAQRTTAHLGDLIENTPLQGSKMSMAQAEARATPEQRRAFQQYIETRSSNPERRSDLPPDLQQAADVHRSIMGDMLHMLQNVDINDRIGFVRDYLPHIYHETPEWAAWMSTRGRRGDIPTYEDAIIAGFTPRFNMVADIDHAYIRAMNRYIAGREIENALKEQGVLKYPDSNTPVPHDWELLKHGRFKEHPAYAPKAIARDYNRWYAQGFANDYTNATMSLLQGLRSAAFAGDFRWHGINEIHEATGTQFARMFDNLREGNLGRAIKAVAGAPLGPISPYLRGRKGMRIYLRQSAMTAGQQALNNDLKVLRAGVPDDEELVNILTEAHAVPHWREFIDLELNEESVGRYMHRRGMTVGNFLKAAGSNIGNIPGRISKEMKSNKPFLAKAIIAPAEVIKGMTGVLNIMSEPLFGHAIPRVKFGSNLQRLSDWYAANPFSSRADAIAAARKIGKAGDNVYGEMNRDTMWIHRGIQHALDLTFLAPGWNIGSGALAGRTAIGTARRALRTMSLGKLDANAPSFSMSNAHWDPNMSAGFGGIVGSLLIGGALTWFATGKAPRGLLDYVSPWMGAYKTDDKGRKTEVHLRPQSNLGWDASVASSVGAPAAGTQGWQPAIRGLENEFLNKVHPLWRVTHDLMPGINSDFKGNPIYEPPLANALGSVARYAGQQMLPFAAQEKSAGLPGLWGDPHLPLLARLAGTAEAGMQWENPAGYVGMMRRKAGPIAEKRGQKKPNRWAPVE